MKKKMHLLAFSLICVLLITCQSKRNELKITIGEQKLNKSLVRFTIPKHIDADESEWELYNSASEISLSAQRLNDSQAVFILNKQVIKNGEYTFCLKPAKRGIKSMYAEIDDENMYLKSGENQILTYHISVDCPGGNQPEYYCRSGFIHPIYSPDGAMLTDGFPVGHIHQHGLFMAWTNTTFRGEFTDFWNQQKEKGTALHKSLISTTSGSVFCGFTSVLNQVSLKHGPVLEESWEVKAYAIGDCFMVDLVSNQKNITNDTLFLNKHMYGGLGLRGSRLWNAHDTLHFIEKAQFLTSEGLTLENANHTRPLWTAIYGETEKGMAGFAVLDHPDNFRHPQYARVHPEMPYFSITPTVDSAAFFAPGSAFKWKYRVITFDGSPDTSKLNVFWKDFAEPIVLTLNMPYIL